MDRRNPRDHAPSRKPQRKARVNQGGATLVVLVLLGVGALLGVGSAVGALIYVSHFRTRAPAADARPADKGAKPADPAAKLTELADRFVGKWEGASPERPSLKVYFDVTHDRITLTAFNVRTNEWGDAPLVSTWRPVQAEDRTLIILQETVGGEKRQYESVVAFTSEDEMSVRSRESGRLVAHFRRVGKR